MKKLILHPACYLVVQMIVPVALLALASCASKPVTWNSSTSFEPSASTNQDGFGGEVIANAISTTATVVSVDHAKRLVDLKRADGTTITYEALPGALGFDEIKPGDVVKVSLAEELAVYLGRNNVPKGAMNDVSKMRIRLPDGTLVAAGEVGTLVYSGKILAINDWEDTVTLQLPDGRTKTIKVSEFINLADVSVGDTISVKASEAAVLTLEKP